MHRTIKLWPSFAIPAPFSFSWVRSATDTQPPPPPLPPASRVSSDSCTAPNSLPCVVTSMYHNAVYTYSDTYSPKYIPALANFLLHSARVSLSLFLRENVRGWSPRLGLIRENNRDFFLTFFRTWRTFKVPKSSRHVQFSFWDYNFNFFLSRITKGEKFFARALINIIGFN